MPAEMKRVRDEVMPTYIEIGQRIALCAKLRRESHPMSIGGSRPFNPDGPRAADTIDALHARNAALEAGLLAASEALADILGQARVARQSVRDGFYRMAEGELDRGVDRNEPVLNRLIALRGLRQARNRSPEC